MLANPAALRYDRGDHFEDNEGYDMIYALYTVVVLTLIGCDQLLKSWTVSHLELGQSTGFLPGFLQLTRVHNYGAAWSSFSGKTVLLVAVTAVLLVAVAYLLLRRIVRHPLGVAAALLILGGGVGNRPHRQRLRGGYVRPAAVRLPRVQSGRLLRGGGRDSGRGVLPVVLRKIRRKEERRCN